MITKIPALQDSPPAAGRFSDIFHFHHSAIIVYNKRTLYTTDL